MKEASKPSFTNEEFEFINKKAKSETLYVLGLLISTRTENITLEKAHKTAVEEPFNQEHIPAWNSAKEFLEENSEYFGIKVDEPT